MPEKHLYSNDYETWVAESHDQLSAMLLEECGVDIRDEGWRLIDDATPQTIGFDILEADDGDFPDSGNVEIPPDARCETDEERADLLFYTAPAGKWAQYNDVGFLCGEE